MHKHSWDDSWWEPHWNKNHQGQKCQVQHFEAILNLQFGIERVEKSVNCGWHFDYSCFHSYFSLNFRNALDTTFPVICDFRQLSSVFSVSLFFYWLRRDYWTNQIAPNKFLKDDTKTKLSKTPRKKEKWLRFHKIIFLEQFENKVSSNNFIFCVALSEKRRKL